MSTSSQDVAITQSRALISRAKSVLVITGAGISVPSGIKPYRGKGGIYETNPELQEIMTAPHWEKNPNAVWEEINRRRIAYKDAVPNRAHEILAKWELENRFERFHLVTQNIDDLHPKAGSRKCSQIHGNLWEMARPREADWRGFDDDAADLMNGDVERQDLLHEWSIHSDAEVWRDESVPFKSIPPYDDPKVRPNIVLFYDGYGSKLLATLDFIQRGCDLVFVIGCSGSVSIVDQLVDTVKKFWPGCYFVYINPEGYSNSPLKSVQLEMGAVEALEALDQAP